MPANFKGRSLLTLNEFTGGELTTLIDRAITCKKLKAARIFNEGLKNRNICGIFLKPSGRTSTSFVVASVDEGAHLQFFPADNIRFGYKESVTDFARLVGRLFDGIAFRGFEHEVAEQLAKHSGIPVWNGLTDTHHPTQVLADVMTFVEEFGTARKLNVAYLGDGRNNMATSLVIGALKFGYHLRIVAPKALQPTSAIWKDIHDNTPERNGSVTITDAVADGVAEADVVYTDVWVSMGGGFRRGADTVAEALQGDARSDAPHRAQPQHLHALPAGLPRSGDRIRPPVPGIDRGRRPGVPIQPEPGPRPGRKPDAHDQGLDAGDRWLSRDFA